MAASIGFCCAREIAAVHVKLAASIGGFCCTCVWVSSTVVQVTVT